MPKDRGVLFAVLAAAFYALNAPLSKVLLGQVGPAMLAALLYLGAGAGMLLLQGARRLTGRAGRERPLTRRDLPYVLGMVILDVAAPICLMLGLARTSAANASLLNNFEIVATALIARLLFGEAISPRLWTGIGLVTAASAMLTAGEPGSFAFSPGSALVLLACLCWGLENNCTRRLSEKDPREIVVVKGWGSGLGSLLIALAAGEALPGLGQALGALALGFVAYGLSIACYIYAQRTLGAARTSAYYALAPFIGAGLSLLIFGLAPSAWFWAALALMLLGAWQVTRDARSR